MLSAWLPLFGWGEALSLCSEVSKDASQNPFSCFSCPTLSFPQWSFVAQRLRVMVPSAREESEKEVLRLYTLLPTVWLTVISNSQKFSGSVRRSHQVFQSIGRWLAWYSPWKRLAFFIPMKTCHSKRLPFFSCWACHSNLGRMGRADPKSHLVTLSVGIKTTGR